MLLPKTSGRKRRFGQDTGPGARAKEALQKKRVRSQSLGVHHLPSTLNARPEVPSINIKHHSYYEIVENQNKKKKLEVKETNRRTPPPGFEFVPIGNPELTTTCKELSREQDAMVFIVTGGLETSALSQQIHRIGHHVRQTIIEQARREIDNDVFAERRASPGVPEPIPETQREIDEQADKAIRDLFPRIPHTDRRIIIEHSFNKCVTNKGGPLVGLAADIPLSRRVQLAVLAHIRHTHTRYDKLLKETTYGNARRAVEKLCLDTLVKWRGDEETGRDQLDEILREVIVISDSEGEEGGDGDDDDDGDDDAGTSLSGVASGDLVDSANHTRHHSPAVHTRPGDGHPLPPNRDPYLPWQDASSPAPPPHPRAPVSAQEPRARPPRRGFKRYQDAYFARWDEARVRVRLQEDQPVMPPPGAVDQQAQPRREALPLHPVYRLSPAVADDVLHAKPAETAHQRAASPYLNDMRHGAPPQRMPVRSDEARDYLVPSVEAAPPPAAEPRNNLSGPIFVRALSQHAEPYHPMQNFREPPRLVPTAQYHQEPGYQHPRPSHIDKLVPVYEDDTSRPPRQPLADHAVAKPLYYRVEHGAPPNADHGAVMPGMQAMPGMPAMPAPSAPVSFVTRQPHPYRGEMRAEPGPEMRYQNVETPENYDRPPPRPLYRVEYSSEPVHRPSPSAADAPSAWPVQPHQGHVQWAPHPAAGPAEPVPTFVRQVERPGPPSYAVGGHHEQLRQHHEDHTAMHKADGVWRPLHAHPEWEAVGPQTGSLAPPDPARTQPPANDAVYRGGYPAGTHYYSRGP